MPKVKKFDAEHRIIVQKQALKGVEDAVHRRPLRVTSDMWKKGGKGKGAVVTHYEVGYNAWTRGRARALANEGLLAHEARSRWTSLAYYETLTVLDMSGGRTNEIATDPARTRKPSPVVAVELDDDDDDDDETLDTLDTPVKSGPTWFQPGHSVGGYEDDFREDGKCRVTVSEDGVRLVCESLRKHQGEPVFCENDQIARPTKAFSSFYFELARAAGVTRVSR
jgi:hypothetical protein